MVNNGSFIARPMAVDDAGNVLVAEISNAAIDKFSPAGVFIEQIAAGQVTDANAIAVDGAGSVYIASNSGLYARDAAGNCINSCTPLNALPSEGVAIAASGNLLVTERAPSASERFISEYTPAGALVSRTGPDHLVRPTRIAIDDASGNVYVGEEAPFFAGTITIFGPTVTFPDATTGEATNVTGSSAELHGVTGADGGAAATCVFQYVPDAVFQSDGFNSASSAPCVPGGPFTGTGTPAVDATVSGLSGGTTYRYRLLATSTVGSTPGDTKSFKTLGPTVSSQSISGITETGATLEAVINPNATATAYRFEYVNQQQFETSGFTEATNVPIPDADIGSGSVGVPVAQTIGALAPGTGYHFRVVALNSLGQALGPDSSFVTYPPAAAHLEDHRFYEQVSPIAKNGADVRGETNAVQASLDGGRITFYSNSGIAGGEGAQGFPSYLASRAGDGSSWAIQGLLPPASTGPAGKIVGWSEDLSNTYVSNKQPTEPAAFYDRRSVDRVLTPIANGGKEKGGYSFAASTPDGVKVLFEHATAQLTSKAVANKPNVYLWDKGTESLVLASALNNGNAPPKGAFAGPYDWFASEDPEARGGAAANYYTQRQHVLSSDGSRVFFTAVGTGRLYMRINPFETQSPVDGGGKCEEPSLACTVLISAPEPGVVDPNGEQPAAFIGATPDGEKAFFISSGKLTSDATTGPGDAGADLYRYDVSTGDLVDLTPEAGSDDGAEVQGVLGMSADGSTVYLAANGVLAPGASPGNCTRILEVGSCNLYVIDGLDTTYIARLKMADSLLMDQFNWTPTSYPYGSGNSSTEQAAARVTPDGQTLLFRSTTNITAYQAKGFQELYRYRLGDPAPQCVSCNPTNAAPTGPALLQDPIINLLGPKLPFSILTRNLSNDGNRVFFETPDKLVSADTNGVNDVYEWEAQGSGTCASSAQNGGCLNLMSAGTSPLPSRFADASANGDDVFFFTAQSLVLQDRDELVDLYDARVNGGIPSQNQPPPPICVGEGCPGPFIPPQAVPAPGSSAQLPGNPKPLKCKKGFKKVTKKGKERCVKVKHRKKQKGRSAAKRGGVR